VKSSCQKVDCGSPFFRSTNTNVGLIASKFHQPFGRFEGTLGECDKVWELENAAGFAEEHFAKW